jgi:hypothetical protein
MATKMGFEGLIYYGVKAATATNQLTNSRDINYNIESEQGDTTIRGSGSSPPINTARVTALGITIEWTMIDITSDTSLEALRVAAAAGNAVAIRTKDYSAGKGFDGDCNLTVKHGKPLKGEQTFVFTATPCGEDRAPQLYV